MAKTKATRKAARAQEPTTHAITLRVATTDHAALLAGAEAAGIPAARLARVILHSGLDQLAKGNRDLDRAIKTSRDA